MSKWARSRADAAVERMLEYLRDDSFNLVAPDHEGSATQEDAEAVCNALIEVVNSDEFKADFVEMYLWYLRDVEKGKGGDDGP